MDSKYESITGDVQPGDEIVLNTAEAVNVDGGMFGWVDRLKGDGYRVIEEGAGVVVLRLAGGELEDDLDNIPTRDNLRVEGEATPLPPEDEDKPSFKGPAAGPETSLPPAQANWIWAVEDVEVRNKKTLSITIDNHDDQDTFAVLFFKTAYRNQGSDFSSSSKTELRLILDEVIFGVQNAVLERDELGAFIHELEISVEPSPSWSRDCGRLRDVFPAPDPPVFQKQVGSSSSATLTAGAKPTGAVGYQSNRSSSVSSPAYSWLQAESNWSKKVVVWRWKLNSWGDSTHFKVNRPSSFASRWGTGDLRKLPFPPQKDLNYNATSFVAEATWEVPTDAIENVGSIRWIVRVKLHTAHVQRIAILPPSLALKCRVTKGVFQFDSEVECMIKKKNLEQEGHSSPFARVRSL